MSLTSSDDAEFSKDQIFDVLSSARRRYVIYYLRSQDEPVEITELARQVAAWEYDTDPDELTDKQQKRVYVSLYQTHVPKLAQLGIVDYDKERGVVSATRMSRRLDTHLAREEDGEPPWQIAYLLLAAIGAVSLVAAMQDVALFATVDESVLGVVIAVAFAALVGIQLLYQRYLDRHVPDEFRTKD